MAQYNKVRIDTNTNLPCQIGAFLFLSVLLWAVRCQVQAGSSNITAIRAAAWLFQHWLNKGRQLSQHGLLMTLNYNASDHTLLNIIYVRMCVDAIGFT